MVTDTELIALEQSLESSESVLPQEPNGSLARVSKITDQGPKLPFSLAVNSCCAHILTTDNNQTVPLPHMSSPIHGEVVPEMLGSITLPDHGRALESSQFSPTETAVHRAEPQTHLEIPLKFSESVPQLPLMPLLPSHPVDQPTLDTRSQISLLQETLSDLPVT
jgi:hypothetical protein